MNSKSSRGKQKFRNSRTKANEFLRNSLKKSPPSPMTMPKLSRKKIFVRHRF